MRGRSAVHEGFFLLSFVIISCHFSSTRQIERGAFFSFEVSLISNVVPTCSNRRNVVSAKGTDKCTLFGHSSCALVQ